MAIRSTPFGKYVLLQRINVGGMAEVFKARVAAEGHQGRLLAIKRILPAIAADQDFISMFIDEAKISVQLDHPNIARSYELGRSNDLYYIAMEYVAGRDLRTLFERRRRKGEVVPPALAAYVMSRVAEGLDYAHHRKDADGRDLQIIHRDVSPQNVLISYDGEVKIIDFGIAKAANKILKTQAGVLKGKFGYMSPEQVRGLDLDRRSDVFSAGIILHELLAGERLFVGSSDYSVLEKVRNAVAAPVRQTRPRVSQELDDICSRALALNRDDRHQYAGELAAHLALYLERQPKPFLKEDLARYMRENFAEEMEREELENKQEFSVPEPEEQSGPRSEPSISLPEIRPTRPRLEGGLAQPSAPGDIWVPTSVTVQESDSLTPSRPRTISTLAQDADRPEFEDETDPGGTGVQGFQLRSRETPIAIDDSDVIDVDEHVGALPTRVHAAPSAPSPSPPPPRPAARDDLTAMHANALEQRAPKKKVVLAGPGPRSQKEDTVITKRRRPEGGERRFPVVWVVLILAAAVLVYGADPLRWRGGSRDVGGGLHFDWSAFGPPGYGHLIVETDPPDAELFLDGQLVKPSGLQPFSSEHVDSQMTHEIVARKEGYHETRESFALVRNEERRLHLLLKPGRPLVNVVTTPGNAKIFIDGRPSGRSGDTVATLEPGEHTIRIQLDCYQGIEKKFVVGMEGASLSFTLQPINGSCVAAARLPTDNGFLQLISHPDAHVSIDGSDIHRDTPLLDYALPPGRHSIQLVAGDDARVMELEVKPGRTISKVVTFK